MGRSGEYECLHEDWRHGVQATTIENEHVDLAFVVSFHSMIPTVLLLCYKHILDDLS